jgi:hypothetical protein
MPHPLYDASVPTLLMFLQALSKLIDKAEQSGVAEAQIIEGRLAPDMFPFPRQIQIATDLAKGAVGRLTGQTPPSWADDETTLAELKARIAKAIAYVGSAQPEAFEGAEGRTIELKASGRDLRFDGTSYLLRFALPNFFFHVTTAYGILRAQGVKLGKPDFFGAD